MNKQHSSSFFRLLPTLFFLLLYSPVFGQFDEIKQIYQAKEPTEQSVIWLCDTAFTFWTNKPLLAEELSEYALSEAQPRGFELGQAKAHHVMGISLWSRDLYSPAMEHFLQALDRYEKLGDIKGKANIYVSIGNLQDDLKNSELARAYLKKGLAFHRENKDTVNTYRALNNLGVVYVDLEQYDSAIWCYKESFDLRLIKGDTVGAARIYNNMGLLNLQMGNTNEAFNNLFSGRSILMHYQDLNLLTDIYSNLGWAYTQKGQHHKALLYLDSGLVLSQKIGSLNGEQEAYRQMKEIAIEMGDIEKAYGLFEKEVALENRRRSAEVSTQIDQMLEESSRAKSERKIAELERESIRQDAYKKLLISALIITFLIGMLVVFLVHNRHRQNRERTQLRLKELKKELDIKNKEISSYTLNFIQKSELMEELKSQIQDIQKGEDTGSTKQLGRIGRIIDETFRMDQDWPMFIKTFEQMHDGFFTVLKEKYPDLSNSELKLCALLRLNMNMKETAKILGISSDSVKTARSRLRKKLGLSMEENLIDFLIKFEQEHCVV